MNIKQFLIFKACNVLPPELKYYILKFVQDCSSLCIQRLYTFKITKNIDIFTKILYLSNENNGYTWQYVNRYIKYATHNITYTYIQDSDAWIDYLETVIQIYGNNSCLNVDNILFIIKSVKVGSCNPKY